MSVYLRDADGNRVLLDTEKAKLVMEGREYHLTGATLDFYDFNWMTDPGTYGEENTPCRVLTVRDRFTGLAVEFPFSSEHADALALALAVNDDKDRRKLLKRALPKAWRLVVG